jgi:hypothetical protein
MFGRAPFRWNGHGVPEPGVPVGRSLPVSVAVMPDISVRLVMSLVRPPLSTKPALSMVRVVATVDAGGGADALVLVVLAPGLSSPGSHPQAAAPIVISAAARNTLAVVPVVGARVAIMGIRVAPRVPLRR